MIVDKSPGCEGTAIEHRGGGWECTVTECTAALELHMLTIRCEEVHCKCTMITAEHREQRGPT